MRKIIPEDGRELLGSPYAGIVGDVIPYNVDVGTSVEIDGNCWMHAFKGTKDVSSDVLSGSLSAADNIITLKLISNEVAAEYRYTFRALVNGAYIVYFFRRKVERESGNK